MTEFIDATGNLVGAYYDIGSIVTKTPGGFEYDDWYLDVFQPAGERPVILDEDELEQAVQVGFLTEEQAEIARREAARIMTELESRPIGTGQTVYAMGGDVHLFDIWQRLDSAAVRELLCLSVGYPTGEKLSRICGQYRSLSDWRLLGCDVQGGIVGYVGLQIVNADEAIIHHIAVVETARRQGIGRAMLYAACRDLSLKCLTAETDADAVGFYEKCGFQVQNLGELYPGVERYRCEWCWK